MSETETAFRDLVASGLIAGSPTLEADGKLGGFAFECELPVPTPNAEGLPAAVPVRVRIPVQFPLSKVEFELPPELRGFAHQDFRTGALCLKPEDDYPFAPSARLRAYVESAIEWLAHAANGTLLSPGEYWELPDFRVDRTDRPPVLLAVEDGETFQTWQNRIGQVGAVQLAAHTHDKGLVPTLFTRGNDNVLQARVSEAFIERSRIALGTWLLLPSHVLVRHRAPRTFRELQAQCDAVGIDLWQVVHRATKAAPLDGNHFVLVGAPIPDVVGGPSTRLHWQPIAIPVPIARRGKPERRRSRARAQEQETHRNWLRSALIDQTIPWGTAVTYPESRSEARGSLSAPSKEARVCVLGCGAIGSLVAEHLARGGVRSLSLFDNDTVELENLSRHTLGPGDVGRSKAIALARRLNGIHPGANVRGFGMALPPTPIAARKDQEGQTLLDAADVLIDCTTSEPAFRWASQLGRSGGKLVIHMFINAHARMLTICTSGRHASCFQVARKLFHDIKEGHTGFDRAEHAGEADKVQPAAGCWQSTFPALGSNIATLVAAAMPIVDAAITRARSSQGSGVVLRRRVLDPAASTLAASIPSNLVEVAWAQAYR